MRKAYDVLEIDCQVCQGLSTKSITCRQPKEKSSWGGRSECREVSLRVLVGTFIRLEGRLSISSSAGDDTCSRRRLFPRGPHDLSGLTSRRGFSKMKYPLPPSLKYDPSPSGTCSSFADCGYRSSPVSIPEKRQTRRFFPSDFVLPPSTNLFFRLSQTPEVNSMRPVVKRERRKKGAIEWSSKPIPSRNRRV